MSNIVSVQFTRFQDLDSHGNPDGEPTYGYRICDDYEADYNNSFDSVKDILEAGLTSEHILAYINDNHESFWLTVRDKGVYLNGGYIHPPVHDISEEEEDE